MIGLKFEFPKRNAAVTVFFKREKQKNFWDLALKLYKSLQDISESESESVEEEDEKKESTSEPVKVERQKAAVSSRPKRVSASAKKTPKLLDKPRRKNVDSQVEVKNEE